MRNKVFNYASDCRPCCETDTVSSPCPSFDACIGFPIAQLAGTIAIQGICGPCNLSTSKCYLDSPVTVGTGCLADDAQWGPDDVKIYDPCKGSRYAIVTKFNGSSGYVVRYRIHVTCNACVQDPLLLPSRGIKIGIQIDKKIAANTWIEALPWIYQDCTITTLCYNSGVSLYAVFNNPGFTSESLIKDVSYITVNLGGVPVYPPCKTCDMLPCYGRITCSNVTLIPNTSTIEVASAFHEKSVQMSGLFDPNTGSCSYGNTESLALGTLGCPGEAAGVKQYIQEGTQTVNYLGTDYVFQLVLKCVGSTPCLAMRVYKVIGLTAVACGSTVFGVAQSTYDNEEPWIRGFKIANPCSDIPCPYFHAMLYASKADYVEIGDCTSGSGSGGGSGGGGSSGGGGAGSGGGSGGGGGGSGSGGGGGGTIVLHWKMCDYVTNTPFCTTTVAPVAGPYVPPGGAAYISGPYTTAALCLAAPSTGCGVSEG